MTVYSFRDVVAAIDGPGGSFALAGVEAGGADEGISVEPTGDSNTMTSGADGSWMHSLSGSSSGMITVRLLKAARNNAQLMEMANFQLASAARHGQNTITIRDTARGDLITATGCAFVRPPNLAYARDGGLIEWAFHAGKIDRVLGTGTPERAV